jgi:hypothetical protein
MIRQAAICLLHNGRSVDKIVVRLTTVELEQVIKIAGRSPQVYPPGAYVALRPIFYSSRASTWHKLLILFGVG